MGIDPVLIASVLVGLALFCIFAGATFSFRRRASDIGRQLGQLPSVDFPSPEEGAVQLRPRPGRIARTLTRNSSADLETELIRANLHIRPAEYVFFTFLSGAVGLVLGYFGWHQNLLIGLAGALLGLIAPRWYLRYLQNKRLREFNAQLGNTIVLMANSLRSGYSLLQTMETVTREMKPPISDEFGRVVREVALGLTLPQALVNMYRRIPSDDLDFLITAISINQDVGGNLATILDTIAFTIRERVRILGEIRSITAQQRLSAVVLSLLPVAMALVIYAMNPDYIAELWQTTCGITMLITGAVFMVVGYFIIRRIASIRV